MGWAVEMSYARNAMKLSRSSNQAADPFSDVIRVLGARVTRRTRLEAAGAWSLAFPELVRLKFVALLRGRAWMVPSGHGPLLMEAGDVCLIGRTSYVVASDTSLTPVDGQPFYAQHGCDVTRLGGDETVGIGGTVTFDPTNADFLLDMLPGFLLVPPTAPASRAMATILGLMDAEFAEQQIGTEVVSSRLADILLIEAIRAYANQAGSTINGWIGALSDPRLGRVLRAFHGDLMRPWTVGDLARVAGMSRAAFSAAFTKRIGQPPLAYLRLWRLTVARSALSSGDAAIATVAESVGYTSPSAFSHAYRRAFGVRPGADTRQ